MRHSEVAVYFQRFSTLFYRQIVSPRKQVRISEVRVDDKRQRIDLQGPLHFLNALLEMRLREQVCVTVKVVGR